MVVTFARFALFSLVLFHTSQCDADRFDHSYFTALRGSWIGEGHVMTADGGTTPVHEEWRAEVEDDRFLIRGTRLSGEETQEFHWIFTFNASTELFDCEYWHTGIESELNFEVSLSDDKAELRTALGDSGGELLVSNSMKENSIVGLVTITNGNGEVFPVASIIHTKEKE